ncbi:hypothetical protein DSO57_1002360 [Entomophthora muscae]|uniref:Uncharacterized protein n=1 Tax=Entomophthora muscae TaxID=34485 RepID=A0ACC2UVS6_9FUNG|nr:hypothetical protein DSO57_1002360 [Entomophthora muscae]
MQFIGSWLFFTCLCRLVNAEHVATITMDVEQATKLGIMTDTPVPNQNRAFDPDDSDEPMPTEDARDNVRQCGYVYTRTVYIRQPVTVYVPSPVYLSAPTNQAISIGSYPVSTNGVFVSSEERSGSEPKVQSAQGAAQPEPITGSLGTTGVVLAIAKQPQPVAVNNPPAASNPVSNEALAEAIEMYRRKYQESVAKPPTNTTGSPQR